MQIWVTNVIGFALLYWELDRGGPVARRNEPREEMPAADWRFSQDENRTRSRRYSRSSSELSGWVPVFIDFLYLSVTNSSAFSPTDTMPLTSRAKVLMAIQATAALLVSLLVVARAVGSLGGCKGQQPSGVSCLRRRSRWIASWKGQRAVSEAELLTYRLHADGVAHTSPPHRRRASESG